jgi:hypothetical protein
MSDPPSPPSRASRWRSPFAIFGAVGIVAAAGAIGEGLYYGGSSALSASSLGTVLGIVVAVAAFVVLGVWAPPNE